MPTPLPITDLHPPLRSASDEESGVRARPRRRQPLVAVAHPHEERRVWLAATLARDGHHVVSVPDGQSLVVQLEHWVMSRQRPGLLVMARHLPGWGGDAIARSLRASRWDIPSLVILDPEEAHLRDAHLGADAVFVWPFDADDLRTAALNLIDGRRGRRRSAASS